MVAQALFLLLLILLPPYTRPVATTILDRETVKEANKLHRQRCPSQQDAVGEAFNSPPFL